MMKTIVRDNRGRRYKGPQPKGRICESEDCTAVLSIYNDEDICAQCHGATPLWNLPAGVGRFLND